MRGQDDPHGRATIAHPPTVGQLASLVRDLAARPGDWWPLAGFDAERPVHVPLGGGAWLTTWPPGHGGPVRGRVSTLLAGELAEVVIAESGVTERPLRANRVRVHGTSPHGTPPHGTASHGTASHGGSPNALTNPGPAFAVSLHAGEPGPWDAPGQLSAR
ncbi:cysteine dioxygenase [Actinomadura sp. GC306]|nr:cysteine dioxygenase [Actinomadura sp. GC306]